MRGMVGIGNRGSGGGVLALLTFLALGLACPARTATPVTEAWAARYNGPGSAFDEGRKVVVDGGGNVYVTGISSGGGTGDDYATVKYDASGSQVWVARYNGPANSNDEAKALAVDAGGNVYVTGYSYGNGTSNDYATVKYDADGSQAWVARYDGPASGDDLPWSLAVDRGGSVYVTGQSYGGGTGNDYATVKYDAGGNELWVQRYNGPANKNDQVQALALDTVGNVYVTGYSLGSGTGNDYATVKYDAGGNVLWVQRYNGPANNNDQVQALVVDGGGSAYVTGYSAGTTYDYATVKYDPSGNQTWVARYNGAANGDDVARGLAVDGGSVYVTGYSAGSGTGYDYATVKYSSPNSAPVVPADRTVTVLEDADPTALDIPAPSDPDNDLLAVTVTAVPNAGQGSVRKADSSLVTVNDFLTIPELNNLSFHGAPDANGAAGSFQYTVTDGRGGSASQTITFQITPVNDAPVVQGDNYTGWRGCPLRVAAPGVLGNDSDGDGDTFTALVVTNPANGSLTLNPNGSFSYTPNPGAASDSFTYRAYDGIDYSPMVTVNLILSADALPPTGTVGVVRIESPTRVYVPITASDEQSGVARFLLTSRSSNCSLEWDGPNGLVTAAIGTPLPLDVALASTTVRVVKQNVSEPAQVEVQVTDCAGNSTLAAPVIAELQLKAGRSLTRTFKGLSIQHYILRLQNGSPGLESLKVWVNGKRANNFTLSAGQVVRAILALRPGNKNVVRVRAAGARGSAGVLTIGSVSLSNCGSAPLAKSGINVEFAP